MAYSVLYVDDDESVQSVVSELGEWEGTLAVTAVTSAANALDLLASGSFDAVISEYYLPDMDGITFLQTVRSRFGDLPFIFFSKHHNPGFVPEAIRNGAISVHFIPFTMNEFREIVSKLSVAIRYRREDTGLQPPAGNGRATPDIIPRTSSPAHQDAPAAAIAGNTGRRARPTEGKVPQGGPVTSPAPVPGNAEPIAAEPEGWEERFRVLTENLPNAILLIDRGHRIQFASPLLMWRFGKNPHLWVTGKTLSEIGLSDPVVRLFTDAAEGVFSSGSLREIEYRVSEDSEPVCWSLAPVRGPDGSVTQVLAVDRWKVDLTDETSCQALLKKISLLNGINRHDILNQATVIASYLAIIEMTSNDPRHRERCRRIREAVDTICERVNATRFYLDIVPRELRWQEVTAVLARVKVPDGIRLDVLPPLPMVFADVKLPVVFSSLLSYTAKYSGDVSIIVISAEETPDGCVIRIEDNGTGIPVMEKKRIFNTSYSDHRDFDLMITAGILAETHIVIQENGTPGEGIRFEIRVPKGWYRYGAVPVRPGDPPATG